jgi:hypothetical protein
MICMTSSVIRWAVILAAAFEPSLQQAEVVAPALADDGSQDPGAQLATRSVGSLDDPALAGVEPLPGPPECQVVDHKRVDVGAGFACRSHRIGYIFLASERNAEQTSTRQPSRH